MVPDRIARGPFVVLGVVTALLLGACATSSRTPAMAGAPTAAADAGADPAEDDDEVADSDGDVEASSEEAAVPPSSPCPRNMVLVESAEARFCIDKYEASLVEIDGDGNEKPFPHWLTVDGRTVRAVSEPDVFPQAFISEVQAEDACSASGKRLCSYPEWKTACMGPAKTKFPYGDARQAGTCHDTGKSAVAAVFGLKALADPVAYTPPTKEHKGAPARVASSRSIAPSPRGTSASKAGAKPSRPGRQAHVTTKGRAAQTTKPRAARPGSATAKADKPAKQRSDKKDRTAARGTKRVTAAKASARPASVEPSVWTQLNDPRLGQVDGALAKTGSHEACVNGYGALDMVGNLHEWVKTDPSAPHGTFAGGYYLDTTINGDGCQYRTTAHAHDYHDYSTGFRCCADATAPEPAPTRAD